MSASTDTPLKNLVRSVADVVSIEGWTIEADDGLNVHVDLTFREARVGGGISDPVRFKLALLRAELVAKSPRSEGLEILPQSVRRERANFTVERDTHHSDGKTSKSGALINTEIGKKPTLAMRLTGGQEKYRSRSFNSRASVKTREIEVNHRLDPDGCHRWEMLPAADATLFGSGWDATTSPRFGLRKPSKSKLPRSLIFQIRCLREDMRITDIKLMTEGVFGMSIYELSSKAKIVAAEAYIKKKLMEAGLVSGELSNPFAEICLLETVVDV